MGKDQAFLESPYVVQFCVLYSDVQMAGAQLALVDLLIPLATYSTCQIHTILKIIASDLFQSKKQN